MKIKDIEGLNQTGKIRIINPTPKEECIINQIVIIRQDDMFY